MTEAQKKFKERVRQLERAEIRIACKYPRIGSEYFSLSDILVSETEQSHKCCILGLGTGGMRIVQEIADTDPDRYHILGIKLSEETCFMTKALSMQLNSFVTGHKRIYVLTTLGKRGRHSTSVERIIQHLRQIKRDVVLVVVKPFLFEVVPGTMHHINQTIKALEPYTRKLYCFSNEDIGYKHLPIADIWKQVTMQIRTVIEKDFKDHTKKDKL